MFGSIRRESETKERAKQAIETYCSLVKVSDVFWDRCCRVITHNTFQDAIKVVDKKNGIFSIMGFYVTASFSPVANDAGKIVGKINFRHEKTDICKILFDVSGRVLEQTCSELSFCNLLENEGLESIIFDFIAKFISSDVMKETGND